MAVKPKDLQYEEAALRKRLEFIRSFKDSLTREDSLCFQTVQVYTHVVDELIREIALEVHRAVKTGADTLGDVDHRGEEETADGSGLGELQCLQLQKSNRKIDMFGNQIQPIALEQVECPNCNRQVAAGRFAPHLEKCTGRGRAAASRQFIDN